MAMTITTGQVPALGMATAMAVMAIDTDQVDITVRAVMGAIGHMMGVMAVIVKAVITAKVLGVIAPMKVDTALEAMEATVVQILATRVGGGELTDFPSNLHFKILWGVK